MPLSRFKAWSLIVASWCLLVSALAFGYFIFLDGTIINPVVTYESILLPVDKTVYVPGECVSARRQFAKHRNIKGTVLWTLVNHRIYHYEARDLPLPIGVTDAWSEIQKIPTEVEYGQYHFEGLMCYQVNPLRTVTIPLRTVDFMVLPPSKADKAMKEEQNAPNN